MTFDETLQMLRDAPGNAVVYSDEAWAVARKSSGGGSEASWHPDRAAWRGGALNPGEMLSWTKDWVLMMPAPERESVHTRGLVSESDTNDPIPTSPGTDNE